MKKPSLLIALCFLGGGVLAEARQDVREAIVKIYTIQNRPDYYNPWSMHGSRGSTGSGCVIAGRKILTNAHVVSDETFLQVRRYGEARRYEAHVLSVSHDADLALLSVDDPDFFAEVEPLEFGALPFSQQEVLVYGFPLGGDTLSVTKGVVSRIEHQSYAHSSAYLLAGQIDAAINPGNSGGPVILNDQIVGVVMQSMSQADNIGYMVPATVIRHFLDDLSDQRYDGFPSMGVLLQEMENPDMKSRYRVPEEETGLLVARILPGSPADGVLAVGDVVTDVDDFSVADDGTVEFRPKERTSVAFVVQQHQVGEPLRLKIWKEGAVRDVALQLDRPFQDDLMIPNEAYDILPTYYIYGGLVFCPLTRNLLEAWGGNWYREAPRELVALLSANFPEVDGEEVVLLLKVLAADVNQGYHNFSYWIVDRVDGEKIRNLSDVIGQVESTEDGPYIAFEDKAGRRIILDRAKAAQHHEEILKTYRIPSDRSEDLK